ncbi:hypothetical protein ASPZODRAFT_141977 [Penicilliopsis zonata CBS 506.65]|uniref:Uncharacterized protein n=1 Tax=Penicilliopsis zonata CBS 506.65 TaxID=1073090 RepID=A0A1L9SJE8_9EURO|nr:hypothetical protein ASPZODRAFT_141977 [Penicilliopsis zonata CBS 506.65]OJJ47231.1 hypothetical protein ASPZODRAFT_141977 [Penicilliopsis zonata CBS 506.65]
MNPRNEQSNGGEERPAALGDLPFPSKGRSPLSQASGLVGSDDRFLDVQKDSSQQMHSIDEHGGADPGNTLTTASTSSILKSEPTSNGAGSSSSLRVSGHKRTATGEIKPRSEVAGMHESDANGVSGISKGNRIIELSMQLRARLKYAAAQVEKNRRSSRDLDSELPKRWPQSASPTLLAAAMEGPSQIRLLDNLSPEGSIASAPDCPGFPSPGRSYIAPLEPHRYARPQISPKKAFQGPKLAPPLDLTITSNQAGRRRRPNPNQNGQPLNYDPYPRHKRHHSEQEFGLPRSATSTPKVLVPGTPPLRSTPQTMSSFAQHNNSHAFAKPRTHSQNALMEQDAIETLLFMSSPENSGYHPSPQHKPIVRPMSTDTSLSTRASPPRRHANGYPNSQSTAPSSQQSYAHAPPPPAAAAAAPPPPPSAFSKRAIGLEAHAGDEIDRMLDQMDSESESESAVFPSHQLDTGRDRAGIRGSVRYASR